jgi:hypothetical protein
VTTSMASSLLFGLFGPPFVIRHAPSGAATDAGANDTRAERGSIFRVGIVPTDGTRLPTLGSGEFGMSPFFGQLCQLRNVCPVDYGD